MPLSLLRTTGFMPVIQQQHTYAAVWLCSKPFTTFSCKQSTSRARLTAVRNQSAAFLRSHPGLSPIPSQVPPSLIHLVSPQLVQRKLQPWKELFGNFWRAELPHQQGRLTCQACASTSPSPRPTHSRFSPYPQRVVAAAVALFVAHLGQQGLAVTIIEVYAISTCWQTCRGIPLIPLIFLKLLLCGIQ